MLRYSFVVGGVSATFALSLLLSVTVVRGEGAYKVLCVCELTQRECRLVINSRRLLITDPMQCGSCA